MVAGHIGKFVLLEFMATPHIADVKSEMVHGIRPFSFSFFVAEEAA